tara:strand:+ start:1695 stop:3641 length:1947 start_codon:yes stop_codon:yes gene_type:complete
MSIDLQIQNFIKDQKDTIPEYLKPLFRSAQQESSGQPDTVGDDAAQNSPNASIDAALQAMSQNIDMTVEDVIGTFPGVTRANLEARATQIDKFERSPIGQLVSNAAKHLGPTIGKAVEYFRPEERRSYADLASAIRASNNIHSYYSRPDITYDLPQPTNVGLGTKRDTPPPTTRNVDRNSSEPAPVSSMTPTEQAQTMASSRLGGIGEVEAPTGSFSDDTAAQWGGYDGPDSGADSSDAPSGADAAADAASGIRDGGRIGALIQHLQTGGDVENAETDLGNANVPMGVVDDPDGAPSPFSGGTGVEDDLDMEVEAGSYVLNAESVQLIGISDINAVIRDAYAIAAALGKPMPQDYDPQNKVPIRISNGEAVIPKSLVDIIGLDKLEKWNQKGLQLRKQKEEFMAQQQQAQPPQGPQVAAEAPMQQQMGQLMAKGGKAEEEKFYNVLSGKEETVEDFKQTGRGKAIDLGGPLKINIGFDLYDKESTLKAADLAGSLLGTTKEQKRNATNLMRRTAAVESDLGTGSRDINRASGDKERFTIGPFQVTKLALKDIQDRIDDPFHKGMNANIKKIKQHPRFENVDFKTIDVDDLKDPYINAIIARLYYTTKSGDIPESLKEQAIYWKQKYNTEADKAGKASDFIKKAKIHNL